MTNAVSHRANLIVTPATGRCHFILYIMLLLRLVYNEDINSCFSYKTNLA